MSIVEILAKPGSGPTYHCHANEDETFMSYQSLPTSGSTARFTGAGPAIGFSVPATYFIPTGTSVTLI